MAASDNFSLVVVNDRLFSFGREEHARLGLGIQNIQYTDKPYPLKMPMASSVTVKGLACGSEHCVLWDSDGHLYAWGYGGDGRLGLPSRNGSYDYAVTDP